jgi:prolipoprotein diacylglyceryltransferase
MYGTPRYLILDPAGTDFHFSVMTLFILLSALFSYKILDMELRRKSRNKLISGSFNKGGTYRKHGLQARMITGLAFVFGVTGAKLFFILINIDSFLQAPLSVLFSTTGFEAWGAIVCGAAAVFVYCKRIEFKCVHLFDSLAPALLINSAIIQSGYFFSDMREVTLWGKSFDPSHLYEGIICLIAFIIFWLVRKRIKKSGMIFVFYLLFMGMELFLAGQMDLEQEVELSEPGIGSHNFLTIVFLAAGLIRFLYLRYYFHGKQEEIIGQ